MLGAYYVVYLCLIKFLLYNFPMLYSMIFSKLCFHFYFILYFILWYYQKIRVMFINYLMS